MFESHSQAVYELLRSESRVPLPELEAMRDEHRTTGKPLADIAIALERVTRGGLLAIVAQAFGYGYIKEVPTSLPPETVALLTGDLARSYGVIAMRADHECVDLLAVDPFNRRAVDDLAFVLGREVRLHVCEAADAEALIKRYYGEDHGNIDEVLRELGAGDGAQQAGEDLSVDDLQTLAGQTPIIRLVNLILAQAIRDQASDIHFEPFEHEFKVRCRVDGVLHEMSPPPKTLALPITSRIKVLANLNIAERRVPQDGRIKLSIAGRAVDLRVSTLPTQFGESVVLRVLDQTAVRLDITELGMSEQLVAGVHEIVRRPNGIFIVTGPTGCGKTTTLYSALRLINTPDLKLLTAEDPVEYEIDGIVQVPVNPVVGLTFSAVLRSFLRQDPDVIMVGEIRDLETAQIAIQASLTGHLVLSTLHTNDAAGAVTRLIDMGMEPFLIASTLEAVLAQRLVRRICRNCRRPQVAQRTPFDVVGRNSASSVITETECFRGAGCSQCNQTGYRGRTGIYEWLRLTDPVRELVSARAPTLVVRRQAVALGMETLRESGLRAVRHGDTSLEEVMRCT